MANLVFIPQTGAASTVQLKDIPEDVKTNVEETYELLKTSPGRVHAEFPSLGELNAYVALVKAYCALREVDGKPAPIRYRKSTTKGLPPTQLDFRITDLLTDNEQTTEDIRDGVKAVTTAAKK